ncbi:MAG: hypothetical protein WAS50_12755 [Nitrospira sp.]
MSLDYHACPTSDGINVAILVARHDSIGDHAALYRIARLRGY